MEKMILADDELAHYGVPGMKWGVRKEPERKGRRRGSNIAKKFKLRRKNAKIARANRRAVRRQGKMTAKQYKLARNRRLREMSDEELERSIKRMKNEAEYKRLTATRGERARAAASKKLIAAGGQLATKITEYAISKAVKKYAYKHSVKITTDLNKFKGIDKSKLTDSQMEKAMKRIEWEQNWQDYCEGKRVNFKKK